MLQIRIDENYVPHVAQNDRAEWQVANGDDSHGVLVLSGFGGENIVTIQFSAMQDGQTDFLITHLCVDNPIELWHHSEKTGWSTKAMEKAINSGLASLLTYPEHLPVR